MSVKSLKQMCMESLVKQIKDLPPQLQEELYGETEKSREMDLKNKVWGELTDLLPIITEGKINNRILEMQGRRTTPIKYDTGISRELINLAEITAIDVGYTLEPIICNPNRENMLQYGTMAYYANREMYYSEDDYSE